MCSFTHQSSRIVKSKKEQPNRQRYYIKLTSPKYRKLTVINVFNKLNKYTTIIEVPTPVNCNYETTFIT